MESARTVAHVRLRACPAVTLPDGTCVITTLVGAGTVRGEVFSAYAHTHNYLHANNILDICYKRNGKYIVATFEMHIHIHIKCSLFLGGYALVIGCVITLLTCKCYVYPLL